MDPESLQLIWTILGALAAWCAVYAAILSRLEHVYTPDYVWLTVVIGDTWIVLAMAAFAYAGLIAWLAWWLLIGAMGAAGSPIIVWQLIQNARRRSERAFSKQHEVPHAPVHTGRQEHS